MLKYRGGDFSLYILAFGNLSFVDIRRVVVVTGLFYVEFA